MPTIKRAIIPPQRKKTKHGNQRLYKTNAWKEDSENYRRAHPLCEVCWKVDGKLTDVTPGGNKGVTDHIISTTVGGSEKDPANFMSMCHQHHNRKRGYESATSGPLISFVQNDDGEMIPERREDIYKIFGEWR